MSNYPDSVNPGDPDAPWNAPERPTEKKWFQATNVHLCIEAVDEEEAQEILYEIQADKKLGSMWPGRQTRKDVEIEFDGWKEWC